MKGTDMEEDWPLYCCLSFPYALCHVCPPPDECIDKYKNAMWHRMESESFVQVMISALLTVIFWLPLRWYLKWNRWLPEMGWTHSSIFCASIGKQAFLEVGQCRGGICRLIAVICLQNCEIASGTLSSPVALPPCTELRSSKEKRGFPKGTDIIRSAPGDFTFCVALSS